MWIFLFFTLSLVAGERLVTVNIPSGPIVGKSTEVNNVTVNTFLGVPYAQPPVGDLRFKRPEKITKYKTQIKAFVFGSSCYQTALEFQDYFKAEDVSERKEFSEDCLFLNIWAPVAKHPKKEKKAVMVWIHGGGFLFGEAGIEVYGGEVMASLGNVIVVTLNYRLGSFGFFTIGTSEEPGDLGLYDQNMALRWVKDNIEHFGGDSDRITIFGQSSGSISVAYHLFSSYSSNLFHRGILQSGTTIIPMFLKTKAQMISMSHNFSNLLGCEEDGKGIHNSSESVLTCLRGKPAKEITEMETALMKQSEKYIQFTPQIDGEFAVIAELDKIDLSTFKDKDIMIGTNKDEMASLYYLILPKIYIPIFKPKTKEDFYNVMKEFYIKNGIFDQIKPFLDYHFDAVDGSNDTASEMAMNDFLSDIYFTCPANIFANWYAKYQKVYYYYFTHCTQNAYFIFRLNDWPGAFHFDEVQYVFGIPLKNSSYVYTEEEKQLSKDMISQWSAFARNGTPISDIIPNWPTYTQLNPQVLDLNGASTTLKPLPCFERCGIFFDPKSQRIITNIRKSHGAYIKGEL